MCGRDRFQAYGREAPAFARGTDRPRPDAITFQPIAGQEGQA